MTKRLLALLSLSLGVALAIPGMAAAHVLKVDGEIGAVLHINPDDNPTTGGPTDYILSFADDSGRFSLSKCNCNVAIIDNGQAIATKPLVLSNGLISENHYTFPKPAVYTIRVTGIPKTAGAFQPFTLNYLVRVTDGKSNMQQFPLLLWLGVGLAIGLILLAAYAMDYDAKEES